MTGRTKPPLQPPWAASWQEHENARDIRAVQEKLAEHAQEIRWHNHLIWASIYLSLNNKAIDVLPALADMLAAFGKR